MYFSHHLELSTHLFEDLAFCKSFSSNFLLLLRPNQVCSQNLHVKFPFPYFWGFHQHQTCRILFFFLVPMDFSIFYLENSNEFKWVGTAICLEHQNKIIPPQININMNLLVTCVFLLHCVKIFIAIRQGSCVFNFLCYMLRPW